MEATCLMESIRNITAISNFRDVLVFCLIGPAGSERWEDICEMRCPTASRYGSVMWKVDFITCKLYCVLLQVIRKILNSFASQVPFVTSPDKKLLHTSHSIINARTNVNKTIPVRITLQCSFDLVHHQDLDTRVLRVRAQMQRRLSLF